MSLQSRLAALITAVGADIKALQRVQPQYVTALPTTNLYEGREIYLVQDVTLSVLWHLRYRSGPPGTAKWEFLGGTPLEVVQTAAFVSATGSSWAALAGLQGIVLPGMDQNSGNLGGRYIFTTSSNLASSNEAWKPTLILLQQANEIGTNRGSNRLWHPMPPPVSVYSEMRGPSLPLTITPVGGERTLLNALVTAGDSGAVGTFWSNLMRLQVVPAYLKA